jgi:hypothetical protein
MFPGNTIPAILTMPEAIRSRRITPEISLIP